MCYHCITLYILLIAKIKDVEHFTRLALNAISTQKGPHIQVLVQTEDEEQIECTVRASTMYEAIGDTDIDRIQVYSIYSRPSIYDSASMIKLKISLRGGHESRSEV